jgi:hypothetical protein
MPYVSDVSALAILKHRCCKRWRRKLLRCGCSVIVHRSCRCAITVLDTEKELLAYTSATLLHSDYYWSPVHEMK